MSTSWATAILMLVGAVFSLLAAAGVLRLPDVLLRMQASAKASTLGLGCLLAGAALQMTDMSSVVRLASIAAFVMLTAPLTGHIVARAATLRQTRLWEGTVVNDLAPRDSNAPPPPDV
jgi:multicomponent Na+:H+ antiporter subunit G